MSKTEFLKSWLEKESATTGYVDVTMATLASMLNCSRQNCHKMIQRLELQGFLRKEILRRAFSQAVGDRLTRLHIACGAAGQKRECGDSDGTIFGNDNTSGKRPLTTTCQDMIATLNELTGWNMRPTKSLARYLVAAYSRKFGKSLSNWKKYLTVRISNPEKVKNRIAFVAYLLQFSVINETFATNAQLAPVPVVAEENVVATAPLAALTPAVAEENEDTSNMLFDRIKKAREDIYGSSSSARGSREPFKNAEDVAAAAAEAVKIFGKPAKIERINLSSENKNEAEENVVESPALLATEEIAGENVVNNDDAKLTKDVLADYEDVTDVAKNFVDAHPLVKKKYSDFAGFEFFDGTKIVKAAGGVVVVVRSESRATEVYAGDACLGYDDVFLDLQKFLTEKYGKCTITWSPLEKPARQDLLDILENKEIVRIEKLVEPIFDSWKSTKGSKERWAPCISLFREISKSGYEKYKPWLANMLISEVHAAATITSSKTFVTIFVPNSEIAEIVSGRGVDKDLFDKFISSIKQRFDVDAVKIEAMCDENDPVIVKFWKDVFDRVDLGIEI